MIRKPLNFRKKIFSLLDQILPGQSRLRYFIQRKQVKTPVVYSTEHPRFCILYYGAPFNPHLFRLFEKSLDKQTYRNFVTVVADDGLTKQALEGFDYLCFVEQGNVIHKDALARFADEIGMAGTYDVIYSDEDELFWGRFRQKPFFKPEYSRYLLWSMDYITSFCCVKAAPAVVGRLVSEGFSKNSLYDTMLEMDRRFQKMKRVPHVLCHRITHNGDRGNRQSDEVLKDYLEREQLLDRVSVTAADGHNRLLFRPSSAPLVSIVIPFKDKVHLTAQCVRSIEASTYRNFEIILVDNRSVEQETACYLENSPHTVVHADIDFNYSRLNNMGVDAAQGEYLVLMNNDIEVITADWLENLVGLAEFPDVGVVAPKLLYPNGTVQHAGMVLTKKKGAKHVNRNMRGDKGGYCNFNNLVREYLAFTGACIVVSKKKFLEVGGFDEELAIISNDVDLCLKLYERGYVNVYTPNASLYHYESASRRGQKKGARGDNLRLFGERWGKYFGNDPYYNPNLSQRRKDFAVNVDLSGVDGGVC